MTKPHLDHFTRAYIEAALWSTNDNSDSSGGEPLDKNYSEDDFTPEDLMHIIRDCVQFQRDNAADIATAASLGEYAKSRHSIKEMAGHDFWLSRCGHGTGFWDRDLGEVGERLYEAARSFGEADIFINADDNRYYEAVDHDVYEGLWGPVWGTWNSERPSGK